MTPTVMPYVKFWTKIASSPTWRATPLNHRFVFLHLIILAGANGTPGVVSGSDRDIAALLGCTKGVVERAINRFTSDPNPSLFRLNSGVKILNWGLYQAFSDDIRVDKRRKEKITLETLPSATEWWADLATKFPLVDLSAELVKAKDWLDDHPERKGGKLFFRNWVARAKPSNNIELGSGNGSG